MILMAKEITLRSRRGWTKVLKIAHLRWLKELVGFETKGETKKALADAFCKHKDGNIDTVIGLYDEHLNRYPDLEGFKAYYVGAGHGKGKRRLTNDMKGSSEYAHLHDND